MHMHMHVGGGNVAEWTMTVADYASPLRWRWVLAGPDGRLVADHDVQLNESDWQYEAYSDLFGYLRVHAVPDQRLQREAEIVAEVAVWAGREVVGQAGNALVEAGSIGPVTVRVIVPGEPPAARQIAYLPLQLADVAGKPLALQDVTLVMQIGPRSQAAAKAAVGERLRVLALFSAPDGQRPLSLRRERTALVRLFDELVQVHERAAELRVLQYGVTRDSLREVLGEAEGWDIVHISGHGQPGELLLETADGSQDLVGAEDLADLLYAARERLKLVTVSACSSAALTVEQQLRLLGVPAPAGRVDVSPDSVQPLGGAVADELMLRLDCAVLAMRYPVVDDFATSLAEKLYRLIAESGQPVPTALGLALPEVVRQPPVPSCPALSVATPALFGGRAPGLLLAAPPRTASVPQPPGKFRLARFPAPPDRFAGRVALMARSSAALAPHNGVSGLLLHGMPGGGKTACALELAHTHAHAFESFLWYQAPDQDQDIMGAFTGLAIALEASLPGLKIVHLLDDEQGLDAFWPVLTELCRRRRVLFVIDNAESLVTDAGRWRDSRFGQAVTALSQHSGLSRLILTSRVRPENLAVEMRTEQVASLPLAEALLLARELPRLAALMDGIAAGIGATGARALARRALECTQGHPKLLELADGAADDPAALRTMLDRITATWQGIGTLRGEFLTAAGPAADADSYTQVLTEWTVSAAGLLTQDARDLFWFLCCLEEADRTSTVAEAAWPQVRNRLSRQGGPPETESLLAALSQQALITILGIPGSAPNRFSIHPAVAAAGRNSAGSTVQAAVDAELGSYWIAASLTAGQTETSKGTGAAVVAAGLRAARYLLRTGRYDEAVALLEDSLARDHSRTTIAAVIPLLRELATALRGQPNEAAAVGTFARALAVNSPAAAERELVSVLDDAVARGDYITGFVASDDLSELARESGRLGAAMTYAEQGRDFAVRAGLGPRTLITAERSRLLVLLEQGYAEQVLAEVRDLTHRTASLSPEPGDDEIVLPWMTEESLLDTGRAAALRLERWDSALSYNRAALESKRRRGAAAADLARTRYSDYGPLLSLGRYDEALAVVQECKAAAEQDADIEMLGVVFGALAEIEDARGHREVAIDRCKDALRYMYRTGNPTDVAGGHSRLGNYTGRGGASYQSAITQFLAAALLHELSGTGQARNAVIAAGAHLRAGHDLALLPADVRELCARIQAVPGCDLAGLLDRTWLDDTVERTYQEIVRQVRASAAQPRATVIAVAQWDPVIAALQEAASGSSAAAEVAESFLSALESQAGLSPLARALRGIMAGDLDRASLTGSLAEADAVVVERAVDVLEGRIEIDPVLWRAAPITGVLLDLVTACRGAPMAPARARQGLRDLSSRPEWSALVSVLERILAGERDATLRDDLADPVHRAVVELVLAEIARPAPGH
jgi:tetratricopeptide (TPR) repeat protein